MVTRITNTMMQNTLLSNLTLNLNRMDKLQNQLSSGRKFGHISDDPSALIYGQAARNKLHRLSHFQGAVETAQSWLTQAETGIMELQKVVGAIYEELVSAGGAKTDDDKRNLGQVVGQLRDHFVDTLNASFGDRFVFAGYNTPGDFAVGREADGIKPFVIDDNGDLLLNGLNISQFDGMDAKMFDDAFRKINVSGLNDADAELAILNGLGLPADLTGVAQFEADYGVSMADAIKMNRLISDVKALDVGPGITMDITMNGIDMLFFAGVDEDTGAPVVRNIFNVLQDIYHGINGDDFAIPPTTPYGTELLTKMIKSVQDGQNHLLSKTAEIGGRQRRLELLHARYAQDNINYEQMRSDAEDADIAEVIMYLKMAETVYQAALSAGARVIQPSLMDFLR